MVSHPKSHMRPDGSFHLFIPPLAFSQISLDETLTILFVTLLGILLIREILKSLAGGLGRGVITPAVYCVAIVTIALLLVKIVELLG